MSFLPRLFGQIIKIITKIDIISLYDYDNILFLFIFGNKSKYVNNKALKINII